MLSVPPRAKLTPLFWNTEKCAFDDIWTKEDPTAVKTTCGTTHSMLNNLVCSRESRFKELWNKQAKKGKGPRQANQLAFWN